jgi:hypothetical protein
MSTHQWSTLTLPNSQYDKDVDKTYFSTLKGMWDGGDLLYRKVGFLRELKRGFFRDIVVAGARLYEPAAEGVGEAKTYVPRKVADMRAELTTYKAALVITRENMDDDFKSYIGQYTAELARYGEYSIEQTFVNKFLNITTGTVYDPTRDLRDGVSLYNVAHPVGLNGFVVSNLAATPSALSESSLAQALTSFTYTRNDDGLYLPQMIKKYWLVVHVSKMPTALQIVKSMSSLSDYKNDGVPSLINAIGLDIEVVTSPFLTSVDAWFLVAQDTALDQQGRGLVVAYKDMPKVEKKVNIDPDWVKYIGRFRLTMVATDYRSVYANEGA